MTQRLLTRPIFGGVFGEGRYALATVPTVANGLHAIRYMVIEPGAGCVLSIGDEKVQVLAEARRVIVAAHMLHAANDDHWEQGELWSDLPLAAGAAPGAAHVSRRRRAIHARTQGRCFYCTEPLDLHGPWHVDHQFPRALGGGDEPVNLVPACPRCNRRKSDRTALEYAVSRRSGE